MRQSLLVFASVLAIITAASVPDFYFNRWSEGRDRQETHAGRETAEPRASHGGPDVATTPTTSNAPEQNPKAEDRIGESGNSMKLTDVLLVIVGFLQFCAIMGQIVIYGRQTKIMGRQFGTMRLANQTARRVADTLPRVERAYISALGFALNGTIHDLGSGRQSVTEFPGPPNLISLVVNNYGKTPGKLVEIRAGFLDDNIPDDPPPFTNDQVFYMNFWVKPDTTEHHLRYIRIPDKMQNPIIYGRVYYRDILTGKLYSSGFILGIGPGGTDPIRAPGAYSDERDEAADEPPQPLPAPPPEPPTERPQPPTMNVPF
jgi:hypothetical protein